jgi:2'-5' RNA ligase
MIVRIWHGWTTPDNADAYESLLRDEIFVGIGERHIPGYHGIQLLRRHAGDEVEFVTLMRFESLDAVRIFAGGDYEVAVVPPQAQALLKRYDARSQHYGLQVQGDAPAVSFASRPRESALIICAPEADGAVGECRLRHDPSAVRGVPAHITILYPFKAPEYITRDDLRALGELFSHFPAFNVTLDKIRRFTNTLYLAPEPALPIRALTEAVMARFPDYPPYGGAYDEVIPHMTVAQVDDPQTLDQIEAGFAAECSNYLPIHTHVTEIVLLDNAAGIWSRRAVFPLAGD